MKQDDTLNESLNKMVTFGKPDLLNQCKGANMRKHKTMDLKGKKFENSSE